MLDQKKIGELITELRKSKQMTQEQLAERLGVSNRSVSRWENGRSMPDLSAFPVLAEELGISVSELLSGEIQQEKEEGTDAVKLVIALSAEERQQKSRQVGGWFLAGFLCAVLLFLQMQGMISLSQRSESVVWLLEAGFLGCCAVGFYFNLKEHRYSEKEIRVLSDCGEKFSMRTAGEMLQFAKKRQKATFTQYEKAFEAIEQLLGEDEHVKFSMVADSFAVNEMSGGLWHLGIAVTEKRLLMAGEKITGRVMVRYGTEILEKSSVKAVTLAGRRIRFEESDREYSIEGDQLSECFEGFRNALCEKSS